MKNLLIIAAVAAGAIGIWFLFFKKEQKTETPVLKPTAIGINSLPIQSAQDLVKKIELMVPNQQTIVPTVQQPVVNNAATANVLTGNVLPISELHLN